MSIELENAEHIMLEHEKHKPTKHHKEKDGQDSEKYSSLYSSFDQLKQHQELLLPGIKQVYLLTQKLAQQISKYKVINTLFNVYI